MLHTKYICLFCAIYNSTDILHNVLLCINISYVNILCYTYESYILYCVIYFYYSIYVYSYAIYNSIYILHNTLMFINISYVNILFYTCDMHSYKK